MLSTAEIGTYRAFGFIVLRRCLSKNEVAEIEAAYERAIAAAPAHDYFGKDGTRVVRQFVEIDPAFTRFAVHPPILEVMRDLWNADPLLIFSDLWSNLDATPWHTDGIPGRQGITMKVTTYLDAMTAEQGALRLLPGSQHREFSVNLLNHIGRWDKGRPRLRLGQNDVPGQMAIEMNPGDVVVWDNRAWHSAPQRADGRPRRGLFIQFAPDPGDQCTGLADLNDTMNDVYSDTRAYLYGKGFLAQGGAAAEHMAKRLETLTGRRVRE